MAKLKKAINNYARAFKPGDIVLAKSKSFIPSLELDDKNYNYDKPLEVKDCEKFDDYYIITLIPNNMTKKVKFEYHKLLAGMFKYADENLEEEFKTIEQIKTAANDKPKREQNVGRTKPTNKTGAALKIFNFARKVAKQ